VNSSQHEQKTPDASADAAEVARTADAVVSIVPRAMRQIRTVARSATGGLSVPQFRALRFVNRNSGTGLTPLAEHLGVALPAASALVGRLAAAGLMERDVDPEERRRVAIVLTDRGRDRLAASTEVVTAWWQDRLRGLSPEDLGMIVDALEILDAVVSDGDHAASSAATEVVA
jgi:DNA-binding MarR family transcriptional regulator